MPFHDPGSNSDVRQFRITQVRYVGILVPGHKYPKMKGDHLYGGTDTHGCFAIYFFNPCFRVLMAWDKYRTPWPNKPREFPTQFAQ